MDKAKRNKWVVIFESTNNETAQIIAGKLLDAGIEAIVDGYTSAVFGSSFGLANRIHVMVDADQEATALAILENEDDDLAEDEDTDE